jgi:hypothetical protein
VDAAQPFTVALPVSASSLELDGQNLVVIYKVIKAAEQGAMALGVIPTSALTVSGGTVTFTTTHFGAFQATYASAPITAAKEVPTGDPIASKAPGNDLVGIWAGACNTQQEQTQGIAFGDSQMTFNIIGFNDSTCTTPQIRFALLGTYAIGDASTVVSGAKNVNATLNSLVITPLTADTVTHMNQASACGLTNWQVGVTQALSSSTACKGFFSGNNQPGTDTATGTGTSTVTQVDPKTGCDSGMPDLGSTIYTIFKIDGATLETGLDVAPNCGRQADQRDAQLDDSNPMTKQ